MKILSRLLVLTLVSTILFSCSKDSASEPTGSYYFESKIDGNAKQFNSSLYALKMNTGMGSYSLSINGSTGTGSEQLSLALSSDKDDFTAGKVFTFDGPVGYNTLAYISSTGSADPAFMWVSMYLYDNVPESFTCTITEATSTYIKGTFSAVVYQNVMTAVAKKTVTEGKFYAKFM
jgi:hypothetical protein